MRRRAFLMIAGVATLAGTFTRVDPGAAQTLDLAASLRIRILSGLDIVRLDLGGVTLDAAAGTMTSAGKSQAIGSQIVELTGNPYLELVALAATGTSLPRRYSGSIFVQLRDGFLRVVNRVDLEDYVASVLSSEVSPGWPIESLRAQAIAVRTYATHARLARSTREYDLSDDTSSQVYRGLEGMAPSLVGAAQDTAGLILTSGDGPASVFYSSSCGGHTASSAELTGQPAPLYLEGVSDLDRAGRAYCAGAPYFRWTNTVTAASMARIVNVPADKLSAIAIAERWPDGRARTISASSPGATVTLDGRTFYSRALDLLGYKVIPSALFDINRDGDSFVFVGHGVGHGVGMCQWGARGRAESGASAAQILEAYFPGTTLARI